MRRPAHGVLVVLFLLSACTGDPDPKPTPSVDTARARLAELAQRTAANTFDATYRFTARKAGKEGTIRLRQSPPDYRLDISLGRFASYFALRTGTVSCTQKKDRRGFLCFLVARPGEPVPDLFDPGVQRLFHDAVVELAEHPDDYDVSTRPAPSPVPGLPSSECFHVERRTTPSPDPSGKAPAGFETGDYCFAEPGVPTSYDVGTGTLTMVKLGALPVAAAFRPPAKPARLPSLSVSPTPSRSR